MDRIYSSRIPGQERIHVEITVDEVSDLLDDLKDDPEHFAATSKLLTILRDAEALFSPTLAESRDAARQAAGQPDTKPAPGDCPACDHPFLLDGCTCRPWTRQDGPPRYLDRPGDTVDMISGYDRGADCPHHAPVIEPQDHPGADLYVRLRKAGEDHDTAQELIYAHARMAVRQHTALNDAPAAGQPAAPAEAHPPRERWRFEVWEQDRWIQPRAYSHDSASTAEVHRAAWLQGRPDDRTRLVRETTTWTVEETP